MRNLSQYFMFVQNLVLIPVLVAATAMLFKRLPGLSTLIMIVGAGVMIVGGWYTGVWVALNGDMSHLSETEVMNVQKHLMIGGSISYIGLTTFICGFLLFALRVTKRQATNGSSI